MKICFFSDVHGVADALREFFRQADRLRPDLFVLLGDVLYHGPRNGVPGLYAPDEVAEILNARKDRLLAVRGNCDAEVDQLLLAFPMMADYSELDADGRRFFLTHGHLWNENALPPVPAGTVLAVGHTHVPETRRLDGGVSLFNPGSISLPKGGSKAGFGFFDGRELSLHAL